MATLKLEDGRRIKVDDSFKDLSPDEQNAFVAQVMQEIPPVQPSAQEDAPPEPTNNYLSGFTKNALEATRGIVKSNKMAEEGLENTFQDIPIAQDISRLINPMRVMSRAVGGPTGQDFDAAQDAQVSGLQKASDSINYQPEIQSLQDLKERPLALPGAAAGAVITNMPDMMLAVANLPAAIQSRSVRQAEEAARNNGRDEPNHEDMLRGLAAAGISATLDRAGGRILLGPLTKPGKSVAGNLAKSVIAEGATEAGQSVAEDVATQVGTERGFNLADTANKAAFEGILGGTGGGLFTGSREVASSVADSIDNVRNIDVRSKPNETIVSEERAFQDYEIEKKGIDQLHPDRPESQNTDAALRNVWQENRNTLKSLGKELYKNQALGKDEFEAIFGPGKIFDKASKHTQTIPDQDFETIQEMDLDPEIKNSLTEALRDIDSAAKNAIKVKGVGPVQDFISGPGARAVGALVGGIGGSVLGPGGAMGGAAAGQTIGKMMRDTASGQIIAARVGGAFGGAVDRALNLKQAEIVRRAKARRKSLR